MIGDLDVGDEIGVGRDRRVEIVTVVRQVEQVEQEADVARAGVSGPRSPPRPRRRRCAGVGFGATDRLDQNGGADPVGGGRRATQVLQSQLVLLLGRDGVHPVAVQGVEGLNAEPLTDADRRRRDCR